MWGLINSNVRVVQALVELLTDWELIGSSVDDAASDLTASPDVVHFISSYSKSQMLNSPERTQMYEHFPSARHHLSYFIMKLWTHGHMQEWLTAACLSYFNKLFFSPDDGKIFCAHMETQIIMTWIQNWSALQVIVTTYESVSVMNPDRCSCVCMSTDTWPTQSSPPCAPLSFPWSIAPPASSSSAMLTTTNTSPWRSGPPASASRSVSIDWSPEHRNSELLSLSQNEMI